MDNTWNGKQKPKFYLTGFCCANKFRAVVIWLIYFLFHFGFAVTFVNLLSPQL